MKLIRYAGKGPCIGLFLWRNQVYALFPSKVVVFGDPQVSCELNDDFLTSAQCIRVHHFNTVYANAFVVNHEGRFNKLNHRPTLDLILRDGVGRYEIYSYDTTKLLKPLEISHSLLKQNTSTCPVQTPHIMQKCR